MAELFDRAGDNYTLAQTVTFGCNVAPGDQVAVELYLQFGVTVDEAGLVLLASLTLAEPSVLEPCAMARGAYRGPGRWAFTFDVTWHAEANTAYRLTLEGYRRAH